MLSAVGLYRLSCNCRTENISKGLHRNAFSNGGKGFFKEQMDIRLKLRLLRTGDADLGILCEIWSKTFYLENLIITWFTFAVTEDAAWYTFS